MICTKKSNLQIKTLFFIRKEQNSSRWSEKKIKINVNENFDVVVDVYNNYKSSKTDFVSIKKNSIVEKIDE